MPVRPRLSGLGYALNQARSADAGHWRAIITGGSMSDRAGRVTVSGANGAELAFSTPTRGGPGLRVGNGSPAAYITFGTGLQISTGSGVIVWQSSTTASSGTLFTTSFDRASGADGLHIQINTGGALAINRANVAPAITSANTITADQLNVLCWSYNSSTGRARVALNGRLTTATSAQTLTHGECVLGRWRAADFNNTNDLSVLLFAITDREDFDDDRMTMQSASVEAAMVGVFGERRIWAPSAAASGIPTLSAATVIDITSTQARPRVTLTF